MKRKSVREIPKDKLKARVQELKKEIMQAHMEQPVKQDKNTNAVGLKKKEVARILTRINQEARRSKAVEK
jgi:ribosomal protein L29